MEALVKQTMYEYMDLELISARIPTTIDCSNLISQAKMMLHNCFIQDANIEKEILYQGFYSDFTFGITSLQNGYIAVCPLVKFKIKKGHISGGEEFRIGSEMFYAIDDSLALARRVISVKQIAGNEQGSKLISAINRDIHDWFEALIEEVSDNDQDF